MKQRFFLILLGLSALVFFTSSCLEDNDMTYRTNPISKREKNKDVWNNYFSEIHTKDGIYHNRDLEENRFDFYRPITMNGQPMTAKCPLIIMLHSGAFVKGSKENTVISKFANDYTRAGYAVATINYNLLGFSDYEILISKDEGRLQTMLALADLRNAIDFFKDSHDYFNINPNEISVMGFSAGAIVACHLIFSDFEEVSSYINRGAGSLYSEDQFEILKEAFDENINADVKNVISIGGGLFDISHIEDSDALKSPILLIHGEDDGIVPFGIERPFHGYKKGIGIHKEASFFFNIGILNDNDFGIDFGNELKTIFDVKINEEIATFAINLVTTDMCGSGCIKDNLSENIPNVDLITVKEAPHVFMLNPNGTFNKTYAEMREKILRFLNS